MAPGYSAQSGCAHRSERETAARISQEIGNLMKEIETLVEEKTKESLDVSRLTREGERMGSGPPWPSLGAAGPGSHVSWAAPMRGQPQEPSRHASVRVALPHSPTGLLPAKSTENWPLVKK